MGRPLNKKYFGNKNVSASGTYTSNTSADGTYSANDSGLGGQDVASVTVTAGSYTAAPTLLFPRPLLEGDGAVRATGTLTFKVVSATISGGTNYGNAQTFDLTVTTAAGSAVLNVTSTAGGAITTVNSITNAGVFTGISAVTGISGGAGTGATVTITAYGLLGATITNAGSGYLGQDIVTPRPTITAAANTGNIVTMSSTRGLVPGAKLDVTGTTIGNIVAGQYFVLTVLSPTTVTLAANYTNFFAGTPFVPASSTATGTMTATVGQHVVVALSGGTGSGGAMSVVLTTAPTNAGTSAGNAFPGILATAYLTSKAISLSDIVKQ